MYETSKQEFDGDYTHDTRSWTMVNIRLVSHCFDVSFATVAIRVSWSLISVSGYVLNTKSRVWTMIRISIHNQHQEKKKYLMSNKISNSFTHVRLVLGMFVLLLE
jgi:hypothetical protein